VILYSGVRGGATTADERWMKSKQNVPLNCHLTLTTLLDPGFLTVAIALLTAEYVATHSLVEQAERVGHEVADVGQVEERQRDANQRVDDGDDATWRSLRSNVTVTCHSQYLLIS